ncbi:hypothetical protein ASZ78_015946, partial [Callipepla squamata]
TWVGNKRRKMSSKSAVESGGAPPGTAPTTPSVPPEATVRNVVNIARSQSQQSSWTSSNNDVIVTGIYSPASSSDQPQRIMGGSTAQKHCSVEGSSLSIAMETGDVDDEYAREEELASMGAQIQSYSRYCESSSSVRVENQSAALSGPGRNASCSSQMVNARDVPDSVLYHSRDYHLPARTSLHTSNFRKPYCALDYRLFQKKSSKYFSIRVSNALQDRTQFSDRDLATLKKYWDNGMTSLGSVCREKIEAVAAELNVDCEIVRTWIGNRRRKYRLMGIEVPPPRGGPADFSDQSEFVSKSALNPGEETATEVGDDNDRNDEVSICLSEGSSQEETNEALQNEEIHHKDDDRNPVSADNVKIEIIDDEESDMISNSEVDQMSSLLDYKNEEVRFIENELENHKQKYFELQTFTRSLILAIKSDDKEQQQGLEVQMVIRDSTVQNILQTKKS